MRSLPASRFWILISAEEPFRGHDAVALEAGSAPSIAVSVLAWDALLIYNSVSSRWKEASCSAKREIPETPFDGTSRGGELMASAFYVGEWLVEADQNRIARGGERIRLDPKWIELLTYLAEHPDEILSKEAILTNVWGGLFVSDEVLTTAVYELRKALGDDAREPRYIKTISRRGYRLIAAVEKTTADGDHHGELNPYRGFSPYLERDAPFFFGREEEVEDVWRKLPRCRLLAIAGPAGAGKTSLLRAGVIPASPPRWGILVLELSHPPLSALARALGVESGGVESGGEPDAVVDAVSRWRQSHSEAVLVLDQFERLFVEGDEETRRRFVELISRVVRETDVHVLLSIRDGFLMHCHRYRGLRAVFRELTPVTPLDSEGLKRALVESARKCGYRFEDEPLIEEILAEGIRGGSGRVSAIAAELWKQRDPMGRCLTRQAYRAASDRVPTAPDLEGRSEKKPPPRTAYPRRPFARWALVAASLAVAFVAGREATLVMDSGHAPASPVHHRLTFRRGLVWRARFAPDGESVFYSAT
jgi:DNA-binding winged helix-turn-helix (wHTH) protein